MIGLIVVALSAAVSTFLPTSVLPAALAGPFAEGGWGMRLILFALLVSLWLIVDRALVLVKASLDGRRFAETVRDLLESGDVAGALRTCRQVDKPLSRIVAAGLARSADGEEAVQKAMDEQAFGEMPALEKRTGYLALMGNVATLMGLFGTIVGLIHSFGAVGQAQEVSDKAVQLAAGISEAMNCTAFGLLTGIVALVAFSALNGKTQRLLDDINHLSLRIYRAWKSHRGAEETAAQPLKAPSEHLMTHGGLNKAGVHGGSRKSTFASLQLTPLIDMFIVMVIFLLMSFSSTGEISVVKDVRLPLAQEVDEIQQARIIAITAPEGAPNSGLVTLEGREVATVQELLEEEGEDWKIVKLTERLEIYKNNWKVTNPGETFTGDLILQVDQNVSFKAIKKVMFSASIAGYSNLLFAVKRPQQG